MSRVETQGPKKKIKVNKEIESRVINFLFSQYAIMIKAFVHVMRIALRQLIMTSLAKQFTDVAQMCILQIP